MFVKEITVGHGQVDDNIPLAGWSQDGGVSWFIYHKDNTVTRHHRPWMPEIDMIRLLKGEHSKTWTEITWSSHNRDYSQTPEYIFANGVGHMRTARPRETH